MSILVNKHTRLLVQGITGREGRFHTDQMIAYGTNVVAGAVPGRGGQEVSGVPVFNTVSEAREKTGANASVIFVPAPFAPDAILEASANDIPLVVCLTEHIPALDMINVISYLDQRGTYLVGPNCPGLLTPGECKAGIIPGSIVIPGPVGVVSRSGTLTYEVIWALTERGIGQSTCVGIGGDPVNGLRFIEVLEMFENDPQTEQIALIGEIGGTAEEEAAAYIRQHVTKPVVAFVAGRTAPPGKRMGHAGAIISGGEGRAEDKIAAFEAAGVPVAEHPEQMADIIAEMRA